MFFRICHYWCGCLWYPSTIFNNTINNTRTILQCCHLILMRWWDCLTICWTRWLVCFRAGCIYCVVVFLVLCRQWAEDSFFQCVQCPVGSLAKLADHNCHNCHNCHNHNASQHYPLAHFLQWFLRHGWIQCAGLSALGGPAGLSNRPGNSAAKRRVTIWALKYWNCCSCALVSQRMLSGCWTVVNVTN